jgi:hypothetical protein
MKNLVALLAVFFLSASGAADTKIKIKKIKGQAALVNFSGELVEGQTYVLAPANSSKQESDRSSRAHRVGLSFELDSFKTKTSTLEYNPSYMNIYFDYGWNSGTHEGGPIVGYRSENNGFGGTTATVIVGAFYDYNFTPNVDVPYLFGAGGKLTYSNISASSTSSSDTVIYPNIFWKWFAFGNTGAIRADVGYHYESGRTSSSTDLTVTGFKSTAALVLYY